MKKGYHDYTPVVKQEVKAETKKGCPFTGLIHPQGTKFVTEDSFKLTFGFDYPKTYIKTYYIKPIIYPKTQGSNGKTSRFR